MIKKVILIQLLFEMLFFSPLIAQTPSNDPHWKLLWSDEFNGTDLNKDIWEVKNDHDHYYYVWDYEHNRLGKISDEGQVYTSRKGINYDVDKGVLKLYLNKDCYICPRDKWNEAGCSMEWYYNKMHEPYRPYDFTGGQVNSKNGTYSMMRYGYIEAQIKVDCESGYFPAFWLYGVFNSNPLGTEIQEIDVFEMTPGHKDEYPNGEILFHTENIMTSNWHYNYDEPTHKSTNYLINDYTKYHTYGLEWTPSKLIYYVDGAIYRIEPNKGMFDTKKIIFILPFIETWC